MEMTITDIKVFLYKLYYKSCIVHTILPYILRDKMSMAVYRFVEKEKAYTPFITKLFRLYMKSGIVRLFTLLYLGKKGRKEYKNFLILLDKYRVNEFTTLRKYIVGCIFDVESSWRMQLSALLSTKEECKWIAENVIMPSRRNYHKEFIKEYNHKYIIDESKSIKEQFEQMELEEAYCERVLLKVQTR